MTKNVIVLLTHVWNPGVKEVYDNLSKVYKTLVFFDKDSKYYNNNIDKLENVRLFTEEDLLKINMVKFHVRRDCNHCFFEDFSPIILYADELLQYDYIYLWEYDVRFNGDYKYLFDQFKDTKQDLVISRGVHNRTNKHDGWWPNNDAKEWYYEKYPLHKEKTMLDIPKKYWYRALFCFSRLSNRLLKVVKEEMPKYPEYFENIVPTLALYNDMSITNICYCGEEDVLAKSWSWLPYKGIMNEKNKLYHAIK